MQTDRFIQLPDVVGTDPVVPVHAHDVIPGSDLGTGLSCADQTAVFLVKDLYSGVQLGVVIADLRGAVLGTVIHQNDLNIVVGLSNQAVHALLQELFDPIDGDHNGIQDRFCHGLTS